MNATQYFTNYDNVLLPNNSCNRYMYYKFALAFKHEIFELIQMLALLPISPK